MMKYMCLIVLISQIHSAPVDDTVSSQAVDSHDEPVVSDVLEQIYSFKDDGRKRLTTTTTKQPKIVEIIESNSAHQTDGSYSFHYRGADGTFREETAVVINPGAKDQHLEINGAYSFFDVEGKEVIVHYTANNRGFVPVGNNIPDIISLTARENSQLPPVDKDDGDDDDVDDSDVLLVVPKKE